MKDGVFRREGFALTCRGEGEITDREAYYLRNGVLEQLLPVFLYKENMAWVLEYDGEAGYSWEELESRGEEIFTLGFLLTYLEALEELMGEYFLTPEGFYLHPGGVYLKHDPGIRPLFAYAPVYRGDFRRGVLGLVSFAVRGEGWFGEYLERVAALPESSPLTWLKGLRGLLEGFLPPAALIPCDDRSEERDSRPSALGDRLWDSLVHSLSERTIRELVGGGGAVFGVGVVLGLVF